MPHRQGDPSFPYLPRLDTSQPREARLRKGGGGISQSNQTQPNSIQPVLPHSDEWKAEKSGPLTTPSNPR